LGFRAGATALVRSPGGEDYFGTTRAQRRSVEQLCRVMLHYNPLCEITFKSGMSPWQEDVLYQAECGQTLFDLMWEPHIHFKKYFHIRRPLHPVIRAKRGI
jgi:hypothetical protein